MNRPYPRVSAWLLCSLLSTISTFAETTTAQPAPVPAEPPAPTGQTAPDATAIQPEPLPEGTKPLRFDSMGVAGGLTAEQASKRAAASSLRAEAKRAQVESAEATVDSTFYSAAPRLTLTARYTRLSPVTVPSLGGGGSLVGTPAPPGPLPAGAPLVGIDGSLFSFPVIQNQYYLNAGLVVPLSEYLFTTARVIRGAKLVRESAELDERAARVTDASNAKLAYYNWVRSKLQAELVRQSLEQSKQQQVRAEKMYEGGRIAQADVLQARAHAAEAELMVRRAESIVNVSEQQLKTAMRAGSDERFEVGEDVLDDFPGAEEGKSVDQLYREAVQNRLEIRVLEKTEYSLTEGEQVQASRAHPRLEAFGNVTYANPNQRIFPQAEQWDATWDVGAQVVWTINDLGTGSAESRKMAAQRAEVQAQKNVLKDALRVEILSAKQSLEEAKLARATAEQGQQAAEAAYDARKELYQYGRATSLELVQAETAVFQARLNVVEAHIALRLARVQLDHAVGRDVKAVQ